jgi:CBS domain-containing membrane protein
MSERRYLVKDLMSGSVVTLTRGQSLPFARELMQFKRTRHLPVVDQDGLLVGLVTHRDLLAAAISSLAPLSRDERDTLQRGVPVADIMREHVWTIDPEAPAEAAARLMLDRKIGCLPVTEGRRLVGILTEADLIEAAAILLPLLTRPDPSLLLALSDLWTPSPQVIEASQPLTMAREVMTKRNICHLPVTIAAELYGLISERDLAVAEAVAGAAAGRVPVGQLIKKPAFVVNPDARPEEVAIDMANSKHSAALAIRGGKVLGIITSSDLARALGTTLRSQRLARERALVLARGTSELAASLDLPPVGAGS